VGGLDLSDRKLCRARARGRAVHSKYPDVELSNVVIDFFLKKKKKKKKRRRRF